MKEYQAQCRTNVYGQGIHVPFAVVSAGVAWQWNFCERWAPAKSRQTQGHDQDELCGTHGWMGGGLGVII